MSPLYYISAVLANLRVLAVRQIDYGLIAHRGPCAGPVYSILGGYRCFRTLFTGILTAMSKHWDATTNADFGTLKHLKKS